MGRIHIDACPVCGHQDFQPFLIVKDHSISGESFELLRCGTCTLVVTQDHPDAASIGSYYDSDAYISHSDTQQGLINKLYHQVRTYMLDKKKAWVERHAPKLPGSLLDVGCGTGYFASHMLQSGWQVMGLEPDAQARKIAIENFGLKVESTDRLFDLSGQFQVITLWHVLEHVHQLNAYITKFKEILTEKGILLVAVPNHNSRDAKSYKSYWAAYDVPRHLWHFTPAAMHHLMTKHGFRIIKKYGMIFDPLYVSMLSEKYKQSSMGIVKGGINGLLSNLSAMGDVDRSSSVIYICKTND